MSVIAGIVQEIQREFDCLSQAISKFSPAGWAGWSDAFTILGVWVAALGVAINALFLWMLIKQVRQGRRATMAAEKSAQAANDAIKESIHARVDARAPRVVALLDSHAWPPGFSRIKGHVSLDLETVLPQDQSEELWLGVGGTLVNEGAGVAKVTLHGNAIFQNPGAFHELHHLGRLKGGETVFLRPGEERRFWWADQHPVYRWVEAFEEPSPPNPRATLFNTIVISDLFEDGVIDTIYLTINGRPLKQKEGDAGHWILNDRDQVAAQAYPIRRVYKDEYPDRREPPWSKTYEEWARQHPNS